MSKYSVEQLQDALVNADAAGDTKSAQILADRIAAQYPDKYKPSPKESIQAESGGLTFTFPAGTTVSQMGEAIDCYFAEHPESKPSSEPSVLGETAKGELLAAAKVANIIPGVGNSVLSGLSWVGHKLGISDGTYIPAEKVSDLLPDSWLPQTKYARIGSDIISDVAGFELGGAPIEAAKGATWAKRLQAALSKGAAGSVASQETKGDVTANRTTQDEAIQLLTHGAGEGLRALLPEARRELVAAADRLGIKMTPAQLTGNRLLAQAENVLSNFPGASHIINKARAVSQESGKAAFAHMIEGHALSEMDFGDAIAHGINKSVQEAIKDAGGEYEAAIDMVDKKSRSEIAALKALLAEMKETYTNDPELAEMFKVQAIENLRKMETISFEALRNLRTEIGAQIGGGNTPFASVNAADLKRIYGAITEDIEAHIISHSPASAKRWEKANKAYAAAKLDEEAIAKTALTDGGTKTYNALIGPAAGSGKAMTEEQARAAVKHLDADTLQRLKAEIVRRAGLASAGKVGTERGFSPATFSTNWKKIPATVKRVIFIPEEIGELEKLSIYGDAVKSNAAFANHSNTNNQAIMGTLLGLGGHFNPLVWAALPAAPALAAVITHPDFMLWLGDVLRNGGITDSSAAWLAAAINNAEKGDSQE
ncbi:hypothetical protein [Pseudescherichia sp.]|uniref:hypothetical protein n=1 Tax=Pseudescherichia sp. TaxID=2055881 RepID=UPI0028A16A8C|nr:hypothetical protein [Pseudescherichia sp.]